MQYMNVGRTFVRFVTMHAFDRQTDGQTALSWLVRACIAVAGKKSEPTRQSECTKDEENSKPIPEETGCANCNMS